MKRIGIFCIILLGLITIQTAQAMTVKDSLVQVLDTIPANKTRLNVLYLLAYQDPMSPSCLNYLDRLLKEAAVQEDIEYQCCLLFQPPRREKYKIVDGQTDRNIPEA